MISFRTEFSLSGDGAAPLASSFRDPAGYVFLEDGIYKRAVSEEGLNDYELFISSGLYRDLEKHSFIVPHQEERRARGYAARTLVPERIDFISYPYEWSFAQFQAAALLTLEIQSRALRHGMSLKDASAFNIQFRGPEPVLIDTLSFERNDGGPWVAYRQFCRHFLAPLALMACVGPSFNRFLSASLDGFPLDLASRLLPASTWLRPGLLLHLHLHARAAARGGGGDNVPGKRRPDRKEPLAESLRSAVKSLRLPARRTEWSHYYQDARHYWPESEERKKRWVAERLTQAQPEVVFDLGANTGEYSRIAAAAGARCVSFEMDPVCANENYLRARRERNPRILPLLMDLCQPSPSLGFEQRERMGLLERPKADVVLALALIHHLRITGQIPLERLAAFLARLGRHLLIEFVPKEDPLVCTMLAHRKDIFSDYSFDGFLRAFGRRFGLVETRPVPRTTRILCHFRRLDEPLD